LTGAIQTLSLHVSAKGGAYKPANWIIRLAQLHKKQTTDLPRNKPQITASSPPNSQNRLVRKNKRSGKGS
jgi:hypothetical protein